MAIRDPMALALIGEPRGAPPAGNDRRQRARDIAALGRGGDTMLAHLEPWEAALLDIITDGGSTNPMTGLPEFWEGGGTEGGANDSSTSSGDVGGGRDEGTAKGFADATFAGARPEGLPDSPPEASLPGERIDPAPVNEAPPEALGPMASLALSLALPAPLAEITRFGINAIRGVPAEQQQPMALDTLEAAHRAMRGIGVPSRPGDPLGNADPLIGLRR